MSSLTVIRRKFPQVTKVVDARTSIQVSVNKADASGGRRKDFEECALARACKRTHIADAAVIGISVSYLIKGTTATRYKTPPSVAREIVSYDRHKEFAVGTDYTLSKVSPTRRLDAPEQHHDRRGKDTGTGSKHKRAYHKTAFVRKLRD